MEVQSKILTLLRWFEKFIIASILLNSICLTLYDYADRENETLRNRILQCVYLIFNVIFILECILKIIGMGFVCHKKAYLRDGWNILDLVVVIQGLLEFFPMLPGLKSIRVLRALRPLRSINAVPSMRKLVRILMISLPNLLHVAAVLLFIIVLFAIFGL